MNHRMKSAKKDEIISYFLKSPSKSRRTFSIIRKLQSKDSKPEYSIIKNEQTNILNKLFLEDKKSEESTRKEFKEIINNLYENEKKRRGDLIASDENNIVLTEYLDKKYPTKKRKELDFKSIENESARALKILGNNSILSMDKEEIQNAIDKLDSSIQKRYASRINSILKTLGRTDIKVFGAKKRKKRVSFINKADLDILTTKIKEENDLIAGISPSDFADYVISIYCCGARTGEMIAITEDDFFKSKFYLKINKQLKRNYKIADTKNKKDRKAIIIPFGIDSIERWISLDKRSFSRYEATKYLKRKTQSLFADRNKHISIHGLRHSYAIHLLRVFEMSISSVALFLGDSIKTAEEYYIDHIASDENIESAILKMKASS